MFHTMFASTQVQGLRGRCSGVHRCSAGARLCRRHYKNLVDQNLANINREIIGCGSIVNCDTCIFCASRSCPAFDGLVPPPVAFSLLPYVGCINSMSVLQEGIGNTQSEHQHFVDHLELGFSSPSSVCGWAFSSCH